MSTGEIAKILDVTQRSVQSWCQNKILKCSRHPNGRYFISEKNFKAFVEKYGITIGKVWEKKFWRK